MKTQHSVSMSGIVVQFYEKPYKAGYIFIYVHKFCLLIFLLFQGKGAIIYYLSNV